MNFALRALAVFAAMTALDIVFALYTLTTAHREVAAASFWAGAIQLANVFVVVSYVKDRRMVFPCIGGAVLGTWIALTYM